MLLNRANILAALTGYRVIFMEGLEKAPVAVIENYADVVESMGPQEDHILFGALPSLREWKGDRVIHNLSADKFTLVNKDYELTVGIPRNDFEDDKLGQWNTAMRMLGRRAGTHPGELLVELLNNGFVTTGPGKAGYDGVAFFSAAHPRTGKGLANQSNKGTAALGASSFEAAVAQLRGLEDSRGNKLNLVDENTKIHLIVPPALEATGKTIVKAEFTSTGGTNTNYGSAELKVLNNLTSTTAWFLAIEGLPVKPFVYQKRREADLVVQNMPAADNMFLEKEVRMGVDGRYALGYGLWQTMYGSTGTVS